MKSPPKQNYYTTYFKNMLYLYSFTPPCKISLMKYFLPSRKTPITGNAQMTEHANKSPHNVISLKLPLNIAKPTGKVLILSVLVTINGHIKLFQLDTKVKIDKVTMAGNTRGKATLKNVVNMLQPSIFALSSKSFGNDKKYCRIIKIPNPPKSPGIINA